MPCWPSTGPGTPITTARARASPGTCARSASQVRLDGGEHRVRALGDVDVDVLVGPHASGSGRRRRGARRGHRGRRPARGRRAGRARAGRRAGRAPVSAACPTTRSTPRSSSSSTAAAHGRAGEPGRRHEVGLAHRGAGGDQPRQRAERDRAVEAGREGGRARAAAAAAATVAHHADFDPSNDTRRHYSVVVRHWSTLLSSPHVAARRGGGMADPRPARRPDGAPLLQMRGHRQGVPRRPRARRGRPRRRGRARCTACSGRTAPASRR